MTLFKDSLFIVKNFIIEMKAIFSKKKKSISNIILLINVLFSIKKKKCIHNIRNKKFYILMKKIT